MVTCRPLPFGVFQALVAAKIRGVAKALKPLFSTARLPRRKGPVPRPVSRTSVAVRAVRRWGGYSSRNCQGVARKHSIHSRRSQRWATLGTLINVDLPWNPSRLEQRLGRIRRFGQARRTVDMLNLVYQDTQDERVYQVLSRRLKDKFDIFGG